MLSLYLFSAIIGVGLILLSLLGGEAEADGPEFDAEVDTEIEFEVEHEIGLAGEVGELVLGLFKPRNLTFLLAAFGSTGALLTWSGTNPATTLLLASSMGVGSMMLTHAVFTWLKRTDSSVDVLSDRDLEGSIGKVTLPIAPGSKGQISVVAAGQQAYLTAQLVERVDTELVIGTEVLIRRTDNGIAEVIPTAMLDLPPVSEE